MVMVKKINNKSSKKRTWFALHAQQLLWEVESRTALSMV